MAGTNQARLLLVDEDTIVLESAGDLLRGQGYEVRTARDACSAISALEGTRFDIVIVDVRLRKCDEVDLLQSALGDGDGTAMILTAGYGSIELAVEALKEGAYAYLTKPIIDDDLLMAVRRGLQRQQLLAENLRLRKALSESNHAGGGVWVGETLAESLAEPEKQIILSALEAHDHCRQKAARSLGINRTTLYKKMRKHGLLEAQASQDRGFMAGSG